MPLAPPPGTVTEHGDICTKLFSVPASLWDQQRLHLLLLKTHFASSLPCSKKEGDGGKEAPGFAGFCCFFFSFKGGFVTSPSLFLFLLSMESFASARPCDWKKSQFIAAEQGGCFFFFFFFYSGALREAFSQGGCGGKAGARAPEKPWAPDGQRTENWWGFSSAGSGRATKDRTSLLRHKPCWEQMLHPLIPSLGS